MHLWKQEKARLLYPTMKIHVELAEKMICFFWVQKTDVEIAMTRAF